MTAKQLKTVVLKSPDKRDMKNLSEDNTLSQRYPKTAVGDSFRPPPPRSSVALPKLNNNSSKRCYELYSLKLSIVLASSLYP